MPPPSPPPPPSPQSPLSPPPTQSPPSPVDNWTAPPSPYTYVAFTQVQYELLNAAVDSLPSNFRASLIELLLRLDVSQDPAVFAEIVRVTAGRWVHAPPSLSTNLGELMGLEVKFKAHIPFAH
jgi:hypothetical protein